MADEKVNDKEDEQCDQQSQASKETTSSADAIAVEEDPVKEATETDQQPVRNQRSSSPNDEEVEPEGKRPKYAGSSSDSNLPDPNSSPNQENTSALSSPALAAQAPAVRSMIDLFTKQLVPVIESWLQANIRTSPPGITLSAPGVASPPRTPRPPKPPRPPGSKPVSSTAQQQRMLRAPPPRSRILSYHEVINSVLKHESELNDLKADATEVRSIMDDITEGVLLEAKDCQEKVKNLMAEVNKLNGGSDDLQGGNVDGLQDDLVDYKLKAEGKMSSEGEIATDDKSCSLGGRVKPIPSVDAEMVSPMLFRKIRSGLGSLSGEDDESKNPATEAAGDGLSKKDENKAIIETDGSQDEMKVDNIPQDEIQDDTTFQDERKDDYTSKDEMKDDNTSQDEMKDDYTSKDEMKVDNNSQDENTQ